jgi:hypothetical protein
VTDAGFKSVSAVGVVMKCIVALMIVGVTSAALAQDKPQSTPLLGPRPVFVPGMYESESRNSHFQNTPIKSKVCLASADYDHFLADTVAQYRAWPQVEKTCALSQTEPLANGFALAMACPGVKTVITYRFSKDLVAMTIENFIKSAPSASSSILTMMRRTGDCPDAGKPT